MNADRYGQLGELEREKNTERYGKRERERERERGPRRDLNFKHGKIEDERSDSKAGKVGGW